jgi:hypothetical protein
MIIPVSSKMGIFDNVVLRLFAKMKYLNKFVLFGEKKIPIIINNYNRLDCLKRQIAWLESIGFNQIYIIDNDSSYPDLITYYRKIKYPVFRLDKNVGHLALWKTVIFQLFRNQYYVYTDSDILPVQDCPKNVLSYFFNLLQKYPNIDKVGFALKIDDLTSTHILKDLVLVWEKKYWDNEIEKNVYTSPIDTTFALYRPSAKGGSELSALRTGGEYIARHLTWYIDPGNLTDEDLHYINTANESSSWIKVLKKLQYT